MALNGKRAAFYSLLQSHDVLVRLLDRELQDAPDGIPLDWYDVLIKLWLAPGSELRMSELAEQVLLSRSWITRRIIQLEDAGLVARRPSTGDDRRGVIASLTRHGREVFARLDTSHGDSIRRHFSDLVSDEEAATIRTVLERITAIGKQSLAAEGQSAESSVDRAS